MTAVQRDAAKSRYKREAHDPCSLCGGTGLVQNESIAARAKKGGIMGVLASARRDALLMSERGRMGGRPKDPSLAEILVNVDPRRSHP